MSKIDEPKLNIQFNIIISEAWLRSDGSHNLNGFNEL